MVRSLRKTKSHEDSELYEVCEDILLKYNQLGDASSPYTCPICGWDENNDLAIYCDESIFKDYTLEDFKKLAEIDFWMSETQNESAMVISSLDKGTCH